MSALPALQEEADYSFGFLDAADLKMLSSMEPDAFPNERLAELLGQIVRQQRGMRVWDFVSQRFAHGTRYGSDRGAQLSRLMRALYAIAAPAAPLMLGAKLCWRTWQHPELRRTLQRALPLLAVFLLVWGAGETRGALAALRAGSRP